MVGTALLAGSLAPLNSTMIVVALPEILADLGASISWGSWIIVSYLVAMAAVQPLGGSLGDRYGRRLMVTIGLLVFLLASVAAAVAPNVEVLIGARTSQAIAGAIALPNGSALVRTLVPRELHGRMFGLIGVGIGAAAAFGPPLGGLVADAYGWRWIFAANFAVILPALVLVLNLPRSARQLDAGRFDLLGAGLLLTALVSLAMAATVWRVPGVPALAAYACGATGIVTGTWFWRHVRRVAAPILDLALFTRPGYLPAGLTVMFSNMTMYAIFLALPLFGARLLGWQPREVGLLLAGMSVPMMLMGPLAGSLADRRGPRLPALLGCAVTMAGVTALAFVDIDWSRRDFLLPLIAVGTGLGISSAPVYAAALQAARNEEAGRAAGLFSTLRYLGSIVCSAAIAAILGATASVAQFRLLFSLLIVAAAAALLAAGLLPGRLLPASGRGEPASPVDAGSDRKADAART